MNTTNTNTTIAAIVTTLASIAAYFGFNAPAEVVNAIITVGTGITMLLAHKSLQNTLTYCGAAVLIVLTYVSGLTGGALHAVIGGIIAVAGYFLKDAQGN